ncbi:MAG: hypothetical protein IJL81_04855, partial [Clostridia bacterium]|nr:hypothetical protein [Clostridia bacterium]
MEFNEIKIKEKPMIINYSKQAIKFLNKQTVDTKRRIVEAINKLPSGDIKKFKGTVNKYRLRVGDFRVIFDKQGGTGGSDRVVATYGEAMPTATAPTKGC